MRFTTTLLLSACTLCISLTGCIRHEENVHVKFTGHNRLMLENGKIVGYEERYIVSPDGKKKPLRFIYDRTMRKVGFITPKGEVYRYTPDGKMVRLGKEPRENVEGLILGIDERVMVTGRLSKGKGEVIVIPAKRKESQQKEKNKQNQKKTSP